MRKSWMLVVMLVIAVSFGWPSGILGIAGAHEGHKMEKMKTELSLTPEQETQIKAIMAEYTEKMMALKKEKQEKIHAILTPEQREKHDAMMKGWAETPKAKKYVCPMHADVQSDKPGECPKCGMTLKKAAQEEMPDNDSYEDHTHEHHQ